MASSKEFLEYILEGLRGVDGISYRAMMGEYVIYYHGVVFGGIYDDRFLVKKTETNEKYNLAEEVPYDRGKPMYLVENTDDMEYMRALVLDTYAGLKK